MTVPLLRPRRGALTSFRGGILLKCTALVGAGVVLLQLFLREASADLPPHCLAKHVVGEWDVHEGLWQPCRHMAGNLAELHDPFCGHTTPDHVGTHGPLTPPNVSTNFRETQVSRLTLHEDFTASFDDGSTGIWTMVYDEGLHLEVTAPRRTRFFAFFKYQLATDGRNAAWSFCHTLMVGWSVHVAYQDSPESELALYPPRYDAPEVVNMNELTTSHGPRRRCWWAQKVGEDHSKPTNVVPALRKSPVELEGMPVPRGPDISQVIVRSQIHSNIHGTRSWEATDKDYVVLNGKRLQTLSEINEAAGSFRFKPSIEPTHLLGILSGTSPLLGSEATTEDAVWKGIMEFDWTNPDHVHMRLGRRQAAVPEAPDQGDCGSCYAITTSTILTSRLWIRYSNHDDIFGKTHVSAFQGTSCNVYNQGCAGGYVFLALKFGHEHGFRTQQCVDEYTKGIKQSKFHKSLPHELQQCHDLGGQLGNAVYSCAAPPARNVLPEACNVQVRVSKWHYVGGTFGACSAEEMQKELWEKGPLAVSIEPSAEFTTYQRGVFQSPYNSIVQEGENWTWEKVDHAVVIVGWGWAKHGDSWLPYWKVRNSWGPEWGENGYARVLRGVNELAIERVAVAADVLLYKGDTAVFPKARRQTSTKPLTSALPPKVQVYSNERDEILEISADDDLGTVHLVETPSALGVIGIPSLRGTAAASDTPGGNLRSIRRH